MNAQQITSGPTGEPGAPEWDYPPPPTAYDMVRDSILTRGMRIVVHSVSRTIMRHYHRWRVVGREHLLANRPCIVAPNHASHLDVFAVFAAVPLLQINRLCSVAAKDYFFSHPFPAFVCRVAANGIPIDREGVDKRGLLLCGQKLKEGCSVIIFPEGSRSRTGELGQFKAGAVLLSRRFRAPIVPTYLRGAFESLPKGRFFPRGKHIAVAFGAPLRFWEPELAEMDHQAAAELIRERVSALKAELEKGANHGTGS